MSDVFRLPIVALERGIFSKLSGDLPNVPGLPSVWVGSAPEIKTPFPRVVLGEFTLNSEDQPKASGSFGDVTYTVHVFSEKSSFKEANTIADAVVKALTQGTLDLSDDEFELAGSGDHEFAQAFVDERPTDGRPIRHVVLRFRFLVNEQT